MVGETYGGCLKCCYFRTKSSCELAPEGRWLSQYYSPACAFFSLSVLPKRSLGEKWANDVVVTRFFVISETKAGPQKKLYAVREVEQDLHG